MGLALAGILVACRVAVSQADIIVYFSEDGGQVSIDMVGTLAIDSSYSSVSSAAAGSGISFGGGTALIISGDDSGSRIKYSNAGVATTTTFGLTTSVSNPNYGATTGGFFGGSFYAVGDGVVDVGAGTRTYDLTGVHFDAGATLASMGAGAFDNQLAWTANGTGDTHL